MRIGVNTLFLIPGEVGGTETYLREVLLAMAKYPDGIEWVLFTNRENDAYLRRIFGSFLQFAFNALPLRATSRYARIIREQIDLPFRVALSREGKLTQMIEVKLSEDIPSEIFLQQAFSRVHQYPNRPTKDA